jgi:hypothetical protein
VLTVPECKDSLRADGKHGWQDDDEGTYCVYCGELRDALGKVVG